MRQIFLCFLTHVEDRTITTKMKIKWKNSWNINSPINETMNKVLNVKEKKRFHILKNKRRNKLLKIFVFLSLQRNMNTLIYWQLKQQNLIIQYTFWNNETPWEKRYYSKVNVSFIYDPTSFTTYVCTRVETEHKEKLAFQNAWLK